MSPTQTTTTPADREIAARDELRALDKINDAHGALIAAIAWADNLPSLDTVLAGSLRAAEVALAAAMVEVRDAREAQGLECPL